MVFKFFILVLLIGFSLQENPLLITVYYESKCPDTEKFFATQLTQGKAQLGDAIAVTLIPFGKAKSTWNVDHWEVTCQHGPDECYGNEINACVLKDSTIDDNTQFNYVMCLETAEYDHDDLEGNGKKCADQFNLSWTKINACANSAQGFNYMLEFGNLTQPTPPNIPYVTYNDVRSDDFSNEAVDDFVATTCAQFSVPPLACSQY